MMTATSAAALIVARDLQILSSTRGRDRGGGDGYELLIELPKVMAQLVDDVYDLGHKRGKEDAMECRWKKLGYNRKSLDELGIAASTSCPSQCGIWYAVFEKDESKSRYPKAPKVVIAVRGTILWDWRDVESNLRVIGEFLHKDERYHHLKEVAELVVHKFEYQNVWMTGHSLGAALALLVAKDLVKRGKPVEAHLYNPPFEFATFAWVGNSPTLRNLERKCKYILCAVYELLSHMEPSFGKRLMVLKRDGESTDKWTPHLYLNKGDFINRGYLDYFRDKESVRVGGCREKMCSWVDRHSLLSLLTGSTAGPSSRVSSAVIRTSSSFEWDFRKSHSLKQWYDNWLSGHEVEKVRFGRQLAQRVYGMHREYDSQAKMMTYVQTGMSTLFQGAWSTVTLGLGTSKRKQVLFLFGNDRDAQLAKNRWPSKLSNQDINDCCIHDRDGFQFMLQKFKKGAVTFYVYAVWSGNTEFERKQSLGYQSMIDEFEAMDDVTNWIKIIRIAVLAVGTGGLIF